MYTREQRIDIGKKVYSREMSYKEAMDMFNVARNHYELTLYMDLFNNEIILYGLSNIRGCRNTYFYDLKDLISKKEEYSNLKLILHTDH